MSAWTVIGHTEVPSATQTWITFSSIPQTYDDLLVVCSLRSTLNEGQARIKLNDSESNFTTRILRGTGSTTASFAENLAWPGHLNQSGDTASTFGNMFIYIPNYRSSTAKSISADAVTENNGTTAYQTISAILWNVTDAITKFEVGGAQFNLAQYSSATLYGITKGSSGGVTVS